MVKFKDNQFCVKKVKIQRKKTKFFWPSGAGIWTPDFQLFSRPWFEFSWEVRRMRSNQNKLLKKLGLYIRQPLKKTQRNPFILVTVGKNYSNFVLPKLVLHNRSHVLPCFYFTAIFLSVATNSLKQCNKLKIQSFFR